MRYTGNGEGVSMSEGADAWLRRWQVLIECRDCGTQYECTNPDVSVDRLGKNNFSRIFMAGGPETCPKCRNLRPVA